MNEQTYPLKYRKKPVVIEAVQFRGSSTSAQAIMSWMKSGVYLKRRDFDSTEIGTEIMEIETLEGTHQASQGDFIIKGIKGEFYPCKPDIFEATYEIVTQ